MLGLLLSSLILVACSTPAPYTPVPLKSTPVSFNPEVWQFWPTAYSPQGAFDVARGERFMWVATSFGVVRLDPVTRDYTAFDQLGLVQRLFPIADDSVYAGTTQGVYYFDGQTWSRVTMTSTYPVLSDPVTAFGLDVHGDLWLLAYASRASLLYHLTGHLPPHDTPWLAALPDKLATPAPPVFPYQGPNCDSWIALATYTYGYRTPDECRRYREAYTILERRGEQYGVYAVEADGSLWWMSADQLLHVSAADAVLATHSLPAGRLAPDPQHGVWIATSDEGLLYATDAEVQHVPIGLERYTLFAPYDLAVDAAGTSWAVTSRGVQRFNANNRQWQLIDNDQWPTEIGGLPVTRLAAAAESGVWLTNGQELARFDGRAFEDVPSPPQGANRCTLTTLETDQAGHLWGTGPNCSVLEFDPARKQWLQHLPDQSIYQLSVGADDTVIALSIDGQLFAYTPATSTWKLIANLDRPDDPLVVADNQGGAWVGLRYPAEIWHYQAGSDHPGMMRVSENDHFTLAVDRRSQLWLSTPYELMRYDGQTWQNVAAPPIGLISDLVTAPDGRLWFAGQRGIAVYDPKLDK